MNIKEKIGQRILHARKAAGLTVKELAEKTRSLKPTRITNWEQGTRSPGPGEILQLAEVLNVEPAYLLCLSDINSPHDYFKDTIIPLLPLEEVAHYKNHLKKSVISNIQQFDHVLVEQKPSSKCFASRIVDHSMAPDFAIGDIIIVNPDALPSPGDTVLAKLKTEPAAIVRKYREIQSTRRAKKIAHVELIPLNPDWPSLTLRDSKDGEILGVIIEQRRYRG